MKKILIYSHDTFGLGNIRRMLAIAKHLLQSNPNRAILILTGSPMLHAFRIPKGIDYLKLPCLARTQGGGYAVKFLNLEYEDIIRMRSNLIKSAMLDFQPDLILVDKKPFGVDNELSSALSMMHRRGFRPKMVLLLRDILDQPAVTKQVWNRNGYHDVIRSLYDQVLVIGSPEIFDVRKEYQFPVTSSDRVCYCGYLRRERGSRSPGSVRGELKTGSRRLVLVTSGGGEDGYQILASYLEGLPYLRDGHKVQTLMFCGPEMSEVNRRRIHEAAARFVSVVVKDFTDDMMSYMGAADLVVSMGGYNTVCEILTLRKRAIIVPRVKPVQEQWIRALRMAQLGLLKTIHPDQLLPHNLIQTVYKELFKRHVHSIAPFQIDLNGLSRVERSISQLLGDAAESEYYEEPHIWEPERVAR